MPDLQGIYNKGRDCSKMIFKRTKMLPQHRHFVADSFTREFSKQAKIHRTIAYTKILALLQAPEWCFDVAVDPEDDDEIFGYIIYRLSGSVIAWVHVKRPYRGQSIARDLIAETVMLGAERTRITTPFLSPAVRSYAAWLGIDIDHAPYLPDEAMAKLLPGIIEDLEYLGS